MSTKIYQLIKPDYECPTVIESFSSIELLCKYVKLNFGKIKYIDDKYSVKRSENIKLNLNNKLEIVEKINYDTYGSMDYYVKEIIINEEIPKSYIIIDYQLSVFNNNSKKNKKLFEIKDELNKKLKKIDKMQKQDIKEELIKSQYEEMKKLINEFSINTTLKEKELYGLNLKEKMEVLNQYITISYEIISDETYNNYSYRKIHGVDFNKINNSIRIVLSLTEEFLNLENIEEILKSEEFNVKKLIEEKINETLINNIDFFYNKKILIETNKIGLIQESLLYDLMERYRDYDRFNQLIGYEYEKAEECLYELKAKNNLEKVYFEKIQNTCT